MPIQDRYSLKHNLTTSAVLRKRNEKNGTAAPYGRWVTTIILESSYLPSSRLSR